MNTIMASKRIVCVSGFVEPPFSKSVACRFVLKASFPYEHENKPLTLDRENVSWSTDNKQWQPPKSTTTITATDDDDTFFERVRSADPQPCSFICRFVVVFDLFASSILNNWSYNCFCFAVGSRKRWYACAWLLKWPEPIRMITNDKATCIKTTQKHLLTSTFHKVALSKYKFLYIN